MTLTDGDKSIVRDIAFEVGEVLMKRFAKETATAIRMHELECKTAETVKRWQNQARAILIVVAIGSFLAGYGTGAFGLVRLFW